MVWLVLSVVFYAVIGVIFFASVVMELSDDKDINYKIVLFALVCGPLSFLLTIMALIRVLVVTTINPKIKNWLDK